MKGQTQANTINSAYRYLDRNRTDTRADAGARAIGCFHAYRKLRAIYPDWPEMLRDARSMTRAVIHAAQALHPKEPLKC